ncbi:D-alanyl-D-alanine carboxypeptidase [Streptomyces sp. NPDC048581]|uniref:D-alanyl-D-alanine carboxypeptidase n=1 Tax=Streptomyces sp. NPDC048581 TaxID=3365572 RepID=UPI00371A581F
MTRETPAPRKPATPAPQGGVDTATRMLTRRELEVVRARLAEAEGGGTEADRADVDRADAVAGGAGAEAGDAEGAGSEAGGAESAGSEAESAEGAGAGSRGAAGEDAVAGGARDAGAETGADGADGADSGDAVAGDAEGEAAVAAGSAGDAAGGSEGVSAVAGSAGGAEAGADSADAVAGDGDGSDAVAGDSEDASASGSADAGDDSVDAAEGSQGAEGQGDEPAASGDDRLRAAVAAWVASTDGKGDKAAPGADEGAEAADEAEDAAVASGADARDDAVAGTASRADSSDEDEAEADAETSGKAADAEPAEDGSGEPAEASGLSDETSEASGDADERAAASGSANKTSPASGDADEAPAATDVADAAPEPAAGEVAEAGEAAKGADPAEGTAADGTPGGEAPADAEPGSDPDDAPAAADGEDPPQGPPAPDDESGTGGAGGNTKAEGGAEAVDQATAVFRAVRPTPTKPPVDQPTTTLKAPKPETPSERTSKFVALKPDIRNDTPKGPPAPPQAPKPPTPDATAVIPQVGPERTAQQPLPPRPPLDLLAELTNTPPPPDTPVRTAIRRVKIWTPLVLLLAIIFAIAQAVRPLPTPTLALTAEESYTFDGSKASLPWPGEGQGWMDVNGIGTMGDFGKQTPVAIGSVAKAMTAYVVLKDHVLKSGEDGEKIEVDALAEKEGGYDQDGESTLNTVKEGDTITLHDAIAAIMIPSANNIARLLARWDAGTEKAFIAKMNATAKDLGMTNTTYTDASGLKETTVSTAEDQVKLGNELVKMPALMEITSMGQWIDPSGQKWYNYNYLVPYNGAIGIKTGTTSAAGGNLLFAARKEVGGETVTLVGAILGQHKAPIIQTVNDVSKVAMLAAQDELTSAKILKKGDVVGYVDDGLGGSTPVVLTKDVTAVGWAGFKVKLSFDADDVPHTAKAGAKVGTLTVGDGTDGAVQVPVALQADLAEPGFTDKLTRIG